MRKTMKVKRSILSATLGLAAITVALTSTIVRAAEARPFQGTVQTVLRGWDSDGNWLYSGTANIQHWGNTTHWAVVDLAKKYNKPTSGTITVTVGNGDSFQIEFVQVWDEAAATWVGDFEVSGGTGKFAAATGSGTITSAAGGGNTVIVTYDGTISY
jgi:hypothetical protein